MLPNRPRGGPRLTPGPWNNGDVRALPHPLATGVLGVLKGSPMPKIWAKAGPRGACPCPGPTSWLGVVSGVPSPTPEREKVPSLQGHIDKRFLQPEAPRRWITVISLPFTVCIRNKSPLALSRPLAGSQGPFKLGVCTAWEIAAQDDRLAPSPALQRARRLLTLLPPAKDPGAALSGAGGPPPLAFGSALG